jgi:broad specificity phosphatase PhoE
MIIYIVRHGFSSANEARLVTGTPDDRLLDLGIEQARRLAKWIKEAAICPDAFFVSHWLRARETAEILFPDAPWKMDNRLGETDAGKVANLPLDDFLSLYPGGESHLALNSRVLSWWADVISCGAQRLCVVAHSGPISCILQEVLGLDMDSFPAFLPAHASLSIIGSSFENGRLSFTVKGFSLGPLSNLETILTGA